jgi:MATE family multidrug resistance protein
LIVTYLLQYSSTVITVLVAGRLSQADLAASSLALTASSIPGLALIEGMATALDTLCAQAYGAGLRGHVGLHVQRMLLLMALVVLPIAGLWIASPSILALLVRQQDLAVRAGAFLRVGVIGLPGYAAFEAGKRFLQAQGDFTTALVVLLLCAPANALLSWLFAFHLDLGLPGAALGQAIAYTLRPLLLLAYIVFLGKWSHSCWPGFSRKALVLRDWLPMLRLSAAGAVTILAEWLAFEVLVVSTAYLDTTYLAAQSILTSISIVMWHVPFSISVAVSTRVGQLVGAGDVRTARRASILYAAVFLGVGVASGGLLFGLRHQLAALFSSDDQVRSIATDTMFILAVFHTVDSIACGCNGMMRGLARQSVSAYVTLAVNYLGAVPFALYLELGPPDLKLLGVWVGYCIGLAVISLVELVYMKWLRWSDLIEDVRKREEEGS